MVVHELPPGTSSRKVLEEIEAITNPQPKAGKKSLSVEQQREKQLVLSMLEKARDESDRTHPVRLVFEPRSSRQSEEEFINLLVDASAGNAPALAAIRDFAINDAAAAWFDPNGAFAVTEFSTVPADPVGHNVSVPGTLALLALGLAGAGGFHRSGRQRASS